MNCNVRVLSAEVYIPFKRAGYDDAHGRVRWWPNAATREAKRFDQRFGDDFVVRAPSDGLDDVAENDKAKVRIGGG